MSDKWFLTEEGKKLADEKFKQLPEETQKIIIKLAEELEKALKEGE